MKICKGCGESLDLNCFDRNNKNKDGYDSKCKACRKKSKKLYTNICEFCGEEFKTYKKLSKFCSNQCSGKSRMKRVEAFCSYCGKKLSIIPAKIKMFENVYCDRKCGANHLKELSKGEKNLNYNRIKYICDGCGKEICIIPSRLKKQKHIFCSKECYKENIGKFYTGMNNFNYNHKEYVCEICGEKFLRKPSQNRGDHIYCSNECYVKSRIGKNTNSTSINCAYCGKEFTVYKSRLKYSKRIYCSNECQAKGWRRYYSGADSPIRNPNITDKERVERRKYPAYYEWRTKVYKRDDYTCQCCGDNCGGNLAAHHIINYSENKELRLKVENGITLCKDCHKKFHDTYGYKNNNSEQLKEFLVKNKIPNY